MAYWNQYERYSVDKPIVAFVDGVATPYNVTVDSAYFGINTSGREMVQAGTFISRHGSNFRFLPRAVATATVAASVGVATTLTTLRPELFIVGDAIVRYVIAGTDNASTAVGTITAINYATGVISLDAAAVAITSGTHSFGVAPTEVMGIYPHSLDFTNQPTHNIAVVHRAHGVYEGNLPYIDGHLKAQLPLLNIRTKF